jgi:hypothetical protein
MLQLYHAENKKLIIGYPLPLPRKSSAQRKIIVIIQVQSADCCFELLTVKKGGSVPCRPRRFRRGDVLVSWQSRLATKQ